MSFDYGLFENLKDHLQSRKIRREMARRPKDEEEKKELLDVTSNFVNFLREGKNKEYFSFLLLTYGTGGGGKTALAFIIISILLASDPERKVALWQTPPKLEELIRGNLVKYMGEEKGAEMGKRFRTITFIQQIEYKDIVLIDEGVINLNAKEALTGDAKKFEQFITGARHVKVIVLVNSITNGVTAAFRLASNIQVYKRITARMKKLISKDSDFIKNFGDEMENFKIWESLVESDHDFWHGRGKISLLLSDYCPWYDDNISRSLATSESTDFTAEKDKQVETMIKEVANEAMEHFKDRKVKEWANVNVLRGWMREHNYEKWRMVGKRSRDILDTIKLKILEDGGDDANDVSTDFPEGMDDECLQDFPDIKGKKKKVRKDKQEELIDIDDLPKKGSVLPVNVPVMGIMDGKEGKPDKSQSENPDIDVENDLAGKFFYQCALEAGFNSNRAKIADFIVKGYNIRDILGMEELEMSESAILQTRKEMLGSWFGYWTEWWFARLLGEEPNTAMNDDIPDLVTTKKNYYRGLEIPEGSIFTIKFRMKGFRSDVFYQNGGLNNQLRPHFGPEYNYAVKNGKQIYYLALFNPKWSSHFIIKKINVNLGIRVTVAQPRDGRVLI